MTAVLRRSIDDVLSRARGRLTRLSPDEAFDVVRDSGAVLVDIRPVLNRELEGHIPGALIIERNVLEWRLDPASDARLPQADYELHAIVFCNEGYTSGLAAAALQDLGIHRATDLIGGYRAWRRAGLSTQR